MSIIKTGIKLFIITFIAAAALGLVNEVTGPVIAENERSARVKAMSEVLTNIPEPEFSEEHGTGERFGAVSYYEASLNGDIVGFVIYVNAKGDQGDISVCVGLDTDGVVLGVKLVSHEETPGLGANAAKPAFLSQFYDRKGPFNIVKNVQVNPNDIVAVTSATNTSCAVTGAVNDALSFYREELGGASQ